jgi:diguanylate cyclase (GGDEF)-like protein/PAS domain S-box-containing protein
MAEDELSRLRDEAEHLRRALETTQRLSHVGTWEYDVPTETVYWSDEMFRLYGYEPGEITPTRENSLRRTHPDDHQLLAEWAADMFAHPGEQREVDMRVMLPDGSERLVRQRAVFATENGQRLVGTVQDWTAEARSHQTEKLLAQIVMSANDAIYTIDRELRVLSWNPGAERLYGYSAEEMLGQTVDLLYPEGHGSRNWREGQERLERLTSGEHESHEYETIRRRKDGTCIQVAATTSTVRDHAGEIIGFVGWVRDITERRRNEAQLAYLANHDPLTGLFNRNRFEEELAAVAARARQQRHQVAVLMLDLDNFKYVNETYGHKGGDELAVSIATVLKDHLRPTDVLARFGGDEYGMLVADTTAQAANELAEALLTAVREHSIEITGRALHVTASVGVVVFDGMEANIQELLADCERAMYQSKENGRNRATVLQPADRGWVRDQLNHSAEHVIRDALTQDHFELYVQPIVDLGSGEMTHCEALLRLRDGDSVIAPGRFLPAAERLGLINLIDRWVIDRVFELAAMHSDLTIDLNLSGATIDDASLVKYVAERLEHHGTDPERIVFELTETAAVGNIGRAREMARSLTDLGCRFAIDDFGAGFSTFYYLKYFPAQYVKIDGEFLTEARNRTDDLVIESIVKIARDLGKQTIAEYVSDEVRMERVRSLGVDYGQGYHFAQPFPAAQLADYPRRVSLDGAGSAT